MGPVIWAIFSELSRWVNYVQSLPKKSKTAPTKIAGLCRNIDWGLSKPCNGGKSDHHYFWKGSCIRLHDPLFSSVLVFVPHELVGGLLFTFSKKAQYNFFFKHLEIPPKHQTGEIPQPSPRSWFVWTICFSSVNMVEAPGKSTELDGERGAFFVA